MKPAENGAELLHKAGLIYKINREILHPLGLALYFAQQEDGTIDPGIGVMETAGHEAIEFEIDPERDLERARWFDEFVQRVKAEREAQP